MGKKKKAAPERSFHTQTAALLLLLFFLPLCVQVNATETRLTLTCCVRTGNLTICCVMAAMGTQTTPPFSCELQCCDVVWNHQDVCCCLTGTHEVNNTELGDPQFVLKLQSGSGAVIQVGFNLKISYPS